MIGRHLATFNLFREADNSLQVTVADANGVKAELNGSGAPLHLCAMNALRAALRPAPPLAQALADWHEDMGDVTWWRFPVDEAPWIGSPLDTNWPGYHTHFTRLPPVPDAPL